MDAESECKKMWMKNRLLRVATTRVDGLGDFLKRRKNLSKIMTEGNIWLFLWLFLS